MIEEGTGIEVTPLPTKQAQKQEHVEIQGSHLLFSLLLLEALEGYHQLRRTHEAARGIDPAVATLLLKERFNIDHDELIAALEPVRRTLYGFQDMLLDPNANLNETKFNLTHHLTTSRGGREMRNLRCDFFTLIGQEELTLQEVTSQ